ncbi:MAG: putative rRNA methylase family protein [Candidatus Roizmanbacteria bacterium GW2011_GWC2_37_13]|uniref:Putative rRNA methylase family protein n=1 Tax=Candidatus Roizmanbacteria bacterium GW2011_GWC2_37_13 TaxID=1618486 RepID=A0A0G0IK27_9BACT|nr:MAG: putative rRNA methylase family protein [Candidatus Roizmanbacteria bacterium GW2011_GWC1_37_12]KKQ24574.1 MAG: putative rRNA methylase family protein [Candidatus Roizmanbacteria bacterium GW2011_GWC2_37_13]
MGFFIVFVVLLILILIFSSKTLSPIPYFPSQPVDIPLIIKALKLRNGQTVFDLGAGDGIVIFEAAKEAYRKKLNTTFVAVEINPVLILVLHLRRLFHPNRKNIKIVMGDMFKIYLMNFINFKNFITIYLYISPWFLEKTIYNIKKQFETFRVVSYMYSIKSLKKKEKIIRGKNRIFTYN